jgi:hypothetical protein
MDPSSPWLDIHRPTGPRRTHGDADEDSESESESESDDDSAVGNSETEAKSNPWDGVDARRRPSQSSVDLPSPDQPADD